MRRLITTLAIVGLFGLSTAPVMAAPADVFRFSDPVTGTIDCGAHQYTFTSGPGGWSFTPATRPLGQ